jgi:lantibiotic leader peptide-processing serine protease
MRSVIALGPVLLVLLVGTGGFATATAAASDSGTARHVVVFAGGQPPPDFTARVGGLGGTVLNVFGGVGFATVEGLTEAAVEELRSASGVSAVEPDLIVGAESPDEPATADVAAADAAEVSIESHTSPTNAVEYARQWNLRAIGAEGAWAAGYLGSVDVSAAVLDTGIDYTHPDLVGRVDLSRSVSLLSLSLSCQTGEPGVPSGDEEDKRVALMGRHPITDLHSHGTAVSGLIASNAHVLAGVTQRTKLFGVKVHDRNRRNCISVYLAGIVYAADQEADVIHLSIPLEFNKEQYPGLVAAVNRAVTYAHRNGAVMVAAAGNAGENLDHDADRFRFCNAVHVICVSATGPPSTAGLDGPEIDAVAAYTNFGRSAIDVAGPGGTGLAAQPIVPVWLACSRTTVFQGAPQLPCRTGGLIWASTGTSFGAAATSGLAALLASTMGTGRPAQIKAAIKQSADDLGDPGTDRYYGKGRIDVREAITVLRP